MRLTLTNAVRELSCFNFAPTPDAFNGRPHCFRAPPKPQRGRFLKDKRRSFASASELYFRDDYFCGLDCGDGCCGCDELLFELSFTFRSFLIF